MKHLIFFDSGCKLCQNAIRNIQDRDKKQLFTFFPLNSEKAKQLLPKKLLKGDTLVLLEDQDKVWTYSKAIFRILKLLNGKGKSLGWLCYVPGLNLFYRLIAYNRHWIGK